MVVLIVMAVVVMTACGASAPTDKGVFKTRGGGALIFDSTDGVGDQIEVRGAISAIEADIVIGEVGKDGFSLLLDTPQVRTVTFHGDGSVRIFNPSLPFGETSVKVGDFATGTKMHLSISVDQKKDSWSIIVTNGNAALVYYQGPFGATKVESIRFSTPVTADPPRVRATITNLILVR